MLENEVKRRTRWDSIRIIRTNDDLTVYSLQVSLCLNYYIRNFISVRMCLFNEEITEYVHYRIRVYLQFHTSKHFFIFRTFFNTRFIFLQHSYLLYDYFVILYVFCIYLYKYIVSRLHRVKFPYWNQFQSNMEQRLNFTKFTKKILLAHRAECFPC